jgi:hypothetical protein
MHNFFSRRSASLFYVYCSYIFGFLMENYHGWQLLIAFVLRNVLLALAASIMLFDDLEPNEEVDNAMYS